MEYVLPNEFFHTYPQWHTLVPSGPGYDNLTDDAGDPVVSYNVRLLYPPTDFWYMVRINLGAIDIGESFNISFTRNSSLKEVYVNLNFTYSGAVYRIIEFTFPYQTYSWTSHKVCAATLDGNYANANCNQSPPYSEEVEREGTPQPQYYWFLHMSGGFGYPRIPLEALKLIGFDILPPMKEISPL